jgi:hypothetical protein
MTPEAQAALQEAQQPKAPDARSEVVHLREALRQAVRALALRGVTPAAFGSLSDEERGQEVWVSAAHAWRAAGVDFELPTRVVLRCSSGRDLEEHEFSSPRGALEAAIAAIELNESYPEAIEVDGRCVMDRASILRAWEDRHDPG